MVDQIKGLPPSQIRSGGGEASASADKVKASDGQAASSSEANKVSGQEGLQLTEQARAIQKIEEAIQSSPEVDEARVEALREQIASGKYQIDADSIAEKLINQDQDLFEE